MRTFDAPAFRRSSSRGGFTMIGLMIVLVIICILFASQMKSGAPSGMTNPQVNIEKGNQAACMANRAVEEGNLIAWQIDNSPLSTPDIDELREDNVIRSKCPDGGEWTIYKKSNGELGIHCDMHAEKNQQINERGSRKTLQVEGSTSASAAGAGARAAQMARSIGRDLPAGF